MRIHVFQGPAFSGSSYFKVQVQGPGPGFSGTRFRVRFQVLEVVHYYDMESEQKPPEFSTTQAVYSGSTSQNNGSPNRKRTLTDPPADQCLQYKCFKIVKDEVTHNWGIFYKADPELDSDLQKKRTMYLYKKWTLWVLISNMKIISLNCNLKHSQIGHFLSQM